MKPTLYIASIAEGKVEESARTGNRKIYSEVEKSFFQREVAIVKLRNELEKRNDESLFAKMKSVSLHQNNIAPFQSQFKDMSRDLESYVPQSEYISPKILRRADILFENESDFRRVLVRAHVQHIQETDSVHQTKKTKPKVPERFRRAAEQVLFEEDINNTRTNKIKK